MATESQLRAAKLEAEYDRIGSLPPESFKVTRRAWQAAEQSRDDAEFARQDRRYQILTRVGDVLAGVMIGAGLVAAAMMLK